MRKILYLFLVIGLAGCGELTGITSDAQGTYTLYSVNGDPVPALLSDDGFTQEVAYGGTLFLDSNGQFVETVQIEERSTGSTRQVTDRQTGTYSGTRNNMTFRYDSGGTLYGEYDGTRVILYDANFDIEIVYRR